MDTKNYWMWHYGDYEMFHSMQVNLRREELGADYPAFWSISMPYCTVKFLREFDCEGGYIKVYSTGIGNFVIDKVRYPIGTRVELSPGHHVIHCTVSNPGGIAAIYVQSDVCPGGKGWLCSHMTGDFEPVGYEECFDSPEKSPEVFPFGYEKRFPVSTQKVDGGLLFDFGTELFGYLNISGAESSEKIGVFYGESKEEALDTNFSIVREYVSGQTQYRLRQRAFRYIYIAGNCENIQIDADYEFLPLEQKGYFKCSNELFNKIYDVCKHTFHLNCREAFLDGIKRDRWIWSGDAFQSARINSYLFADPAIVRRTAIGLVGREPFEQHINTIVDYSTLWIAGLYEHYMTYADKDFLARIYPTAKKLMAFCETRVGDDGFVCGKDGDWTFIDWSDIDKTGAVCAEQMLMIAAYTAMSEISGVLGCDGGEYAKKSLVLKEKVNRFYWSESLGAYIDSFESGKNNVTRHANIFAVMFDIATPEQVESIVKNVLMNDSITKITTPYFEGYELDVMGKVGNLDVIEGMLDSYWGGMIRLGAITVWEEFDPEKNGVEHYSMYGRKYSKSLCHAWGAGPIYLFGRYYLGVYPTAPGYASFNVEPKLGGLESMEGKVPVNGGEVSIRMDKNELVVCATKDGGTLLFGGKSYELLKDVPVVLQV